MKFSLHPKYLPLLVSGCGLLGMLLRIWTLGKGPDALGLYEPQTVAWILLIVVMVLTLGLILTSVWGLKARGQYGDHFPPSIEATVGCGAAALALVIVVIRAIPRLTAEAAFVYATAMIVLGFAAAAGMVLAAVSRYTGGKQTFWGLLLSCGFLALRAFDCCKNWSNESQTAVFLPELLASVSIMLAFFYLAGMASGLSFRRHSLFWSFAAAFFCILALPGSSDWLFYAGMAAFLLTNHCALMPLNKAASPEKTQEQPNSEE